MVPWIVPKEFYGDPMKNLRQTLSVDGAQMQEARAGDMIHSLYELIEYASSIITLFPGDVINNGTSGGVGMGTAVRGEQRFLQPGRGDRRDDRRHRHAAHAGRGRPPATAAGRELRARGCRRSWGPR
jgi:2-keto-4-pentenoate hydratase/2-oxohepta-3-ene-1,7-dioic acid hydratase in catechol pathway